MINLSDFETDRKLTARVLESTRITPRDVAEVRNIRFSIAPPGFPYRAGQHVGVIVPGDHGYGHKNHFRLYTIANACSENEADCKRPGQGESEIELCVRRCFYIDEVSGEEYPGIASNYLCDLKPGDEITLTGPYGDAFRVPDDPSSNIIMIGSGTGIAPFRAFIQHIYERSPDWKGQVRLYYGARTGAEKLYRNDLKNDLDEYYDKETFRAFEGLIDRPWIHREETGLDNVLQENAKEIWELMQDPKTHVYIAGLPKTKHDFEKVLREVAGSNARWRWTREEMTEQGRWSELIYS